MEVVAWQQACPHLLDSGSKRARIYSINVMRGTPGRYPVHDPAMGWLFAVALGLNRHRRIVLLSLVPLALGQTPVEVAQATTRTCGYLGAPTICRSPPSLTVPSCGTERPPLVPGMQAQQTATRSSVFDSRREWRAQLALGLEIEAKSGKTRQEN
jgi:hypothetical protein